MPITVVTTKGQIVIPAVFRKKLNLNKGTKLYIEEKNNQLMLKPVTHEYFEKIAGIMQTKGKLSKALIEERQKDNKRGA